ncbi:MAG TPA: ABC transporter substrate-binding protein [Balneolaceae bacterium]|nr:ABC transporter substrate-binding protein [Balneolaceae bacterium]
MTFIKSSSHFVYPVLGILLCLGFILQCNKNSKGTHNSFTGDSTKETSQSVHIRYAQGFSVSQHKKYTLVRVFNPFENHSDTLRYMLIPRGQSRPAAYPNAQTIRTPIRSLIATSTTQIALTETLNADSVVKGMVGAKYAYSPDIRRRLKQGKIQSFKEGDFNREVALNMHPELVMISAGQVSQYDDYKLLTQSGIGVFVNADWLETTPLGKAEWLKVMGLLLGKEKMAQKKFKKVAKRYNNLKKKVKNVANKPLVINNMPYKGAWFVSGGQSYMAQYFRDAGADYPWFNNKSTGGLKLSFETVFKAGLKADVWLDPGKARTKADILAKDRRLKDFKAFKTDRIYNNNKRVSPTGGNDFWEQGVVRPDIVLSDLIKILHPNVLPNDSLYFYQKVK